jgi:hypothetical protein
MAVRWEQVRVSMDKVRAAVEAQAGYPGIRRYPLLVVSGEHGEASCQKVGASATLCELRLRAAIY